MWKATTITQCRQRRQRLSGTVALVATMGALHEGHLSLIESASRIADQVVVSIFVNPTQFGPNEDFARYPRRLDEDLARCETAGVAGVFCPSPDEMYPPGQLDCRMSLPPLTDQLEARCRPGHFEGVCWVVAKLFHIVEPDVVCFGQKDYQQWRVIEAMVHSLAMPIRVVGLPTVREADGLAMSSRNAYLDPDRRRRALALINAIRQAQILIEQDGETDPSAVEDMMRQVLSASDLTIDYAVVRHPKTLVQLECLEPDLTGGVVALIAAWADSVRLIDSMVLGVAGRHLACQDF